MRCATNLFVAELAGSLIDYVLSVDWIGMEEYHKLLQGKKTIKRKACLKSI